jgi:hypothetical protein
VLQVLLPPRAGGQEMEDSRQWGDEDYQRHLC